MLSMVLLSVDLFMLLEVLGTFEGLLADVAYMRLKRGMDWLPNEREAKARGRERGTYLEGDL